MALKVLTYGIKFAPNVIFASLSLFPAAQEIAIR